MQFSALPTMLDGSAPGLAGPALALDAPIHAALITGSAAVLAVILGAVAAVARIRAGHAYDRRIANLEKLQDRTADLAAVVRRYGAKVRAAADAAKAELTQAGAAGSQDVLVSSKVPGKVQRELDSAIDLVVVAASRVEEAVIVSLNEHWRSMATRHSLDSSDVNAAQETAARSWFDQACAQALVASGGKLTCEQRSHWRGQLASVVDDSNNTDPTV